MTENAPRCPACDYNLTGVQGGRCPECGWHIDPGLLAFAQHADADGLYRRPGTLLASIGALGSVADPLLVLWCTSGVVRAAVAGFIAATLLVGVLHVSLLWRISGSRLTAGHGVQRTAVYRVVGILQIAVAAACVVSAFGAALRGSVLVVPAVVLAAGPGILLVICSYTLPANRTDWIRALRTTMAAQRERRTDQAPFTVEAFGPFTRETIDVVSDSTARRTSAMIESLIDSTWRDKLTEAQRRGGTLFDGPLGRLIRSEVIRHRTGGPGDVGTPRQPARALRLVLGTTCYRDFVGTNLYNAHLAEWYGPQCLANPLGTTAVVVTTDGYLLYGRRSRRVAFHAGYLHTFGGALEPADRRADGTFDVFGAVRRELREELRLTDDEIAEPIVIGLVRDHQIVQPELLFESRVTLSRDALLARFDAGTDPEHESIDGCRDHPESIIPFIRRAGRIAPVALASLLLHGRLRWQRDWYDRACLDLFAALPPERQTSGTPR